MTAVLHNAAVGWLESAGTPPSQKSNGVPVMIVTLIVIDLETLAPPPHSSTVNEESRRGRWCLGGHAILPTLRNDQDNEFHCALSETFRSQSGLGTIL